jgi:energy-coupling factor transporter transmembrane protein EcfT
LHFVWEFRVFWVWWWHGFDASWQLFLRGFLRFFLLLLLLLLFSHDGERYGWRGVCSVWG